MSESSMKSNTLSLSPQSPLVFRSGRPFGAAGDSGGAESLGFPYPASLAGAVRAALVNVHNLPIVSDGDHTVVRTNISVAGPFLTQVLVGQKKCHWYLPKPANALYSDDADSSDKTQVHCLMPKLAWLDNTDLAYQLAPLTTKSLGPSKPKAGPAWWSLAEIEKWLSGTPDPSKPIVDNIKRANVKDQFCDGPSLSTRTHVQIDNGTLMAKEAQLFQSSGLDFAERRDTKGVLLQGKLGLVATVQSPYDHSLLAGSIHRFGADGRTVRLGIADADVLSVSKHQHVYTQGDTLMLYLATPGLFLKSAWCPDWLVSDDTNAPLVGTLPHTQCQVKLIAAAVERWLPYSGWSMQYQAERPMQRVVPAGAVYFLEITSAVNENDLNTLQNWGLRSVASDAQALRDGWAQSLLGLAPNNGITIIEKGQE